MALFQKIAKLPPRAFGFGLWWMWIYLAVLSPTFAQSPFAAQPMGGASLSFLTIASGAVIYAAAIPLAWAKPGLLQRRSAAVGAGVVAAAATAAMAFSGLFGSAGNTVFIGGSLVAGMGISVIYLQWGVFYASLEPKHVAPCTVVSFLLAIVLASLVLDRGVLTSLAAIVIPLGAALLVPAGASKGIAARDKGTPSTIAGEGRTISPGQPTLCTSAAKASPHRPFPASVVALILVFSFAFGLFRVLLSPDGPSSHDMGLVMLCSAAMAFVMLAIIMAFSISLGWDSVFYLALPLIAAASLVLSVVDFGDRAFVWAIIVAAVRVADLIMWMIFANVARASRRSPVAVFALGKLTAQIGVLAGLLVARWLVASFAVESLLLPTALAFLVLVTLLGSTAALKNRIAADSPTVEGGSTNARACGPEDEASAAQTRIQAIAQARGLSPRETEIFLLLAKGRTIPRIADELVLANSTVTTHVRGLYRKLDVHNRQELLDFVERA
ncbi:helix-turn-helix transcriptional regulator [Adlercreutzia aquisgranensis]|uniref:helix-turn-helix transcriptional regulator n=1 Tax=Adlercreutzia aquisgranensis TaxID=2941323 RepID=UPI002041E089|nr:helix-turn-helix transcriptional regulator [Adlercreutzia aquisgranensis]